MARFNKAQIDAISSTVSKWDDAKSAQRASEELMELGLSLLHYCRGKADIVQVKSEMADVLIALKHLEIKYGDYQDEPDMKVVKGNGEPNETLNP